MDIATQSKLIHQIIHPHRNDAQGILEDLQLAGLPSRELVHQEIEENLLLPRETLPDHWLSSYQVCDGV
jgi:antiviral helicase SKI2